MDDRPDSTKRVREITWLGIWVNLILSIAKILAGVFGHSKALIADGIESGCDIVTSSVLLVGARYWSAPPDADHPYGHRRIETILTLGIGLVVAGVGGSIVYSALKSLQQGTASHPTMLALVVAIATVGGKELLYRWSAREGHKIQSMAVIANALHHRSDAISSIPVVLSVAAAQILPTWTFLDAVGALIAGGFILKAARDIAWPALRELSEAGAEPGILASLEATAVTIAGVTSVHGVRSRFVGASLFVELHIVVDPEMSVSQAHRIADRVAGRLVADFPDVVDVQVHLDPFDDSTLAG